MKRALLLLCLASTLAAAEGPSAALSFPEAGDASLGDEAAALREQLSGGASAYYKLPAAALPSRNAQGAWNPAALREALAGQEPVGLDGAKLPDGSKASVSGKKAKAGEHWVQATGLPKVMLIENSSTVSPLSKGLAAWKWPHTVKGFADIEADPTRWMDSTAVDLVVFSSPGWWGDFANPPGGPSRLPEKVAVALRDFVSRGGSALFIDIAQWDLEKAWPKTLSLAPLGPYGISKLKVANGAQGGLALAPVGVGVEKLQRPEAVELIGEPSFAYPDGSERSLHAAYAMPDPAGGAGWVAGLSFHVFEQDDSLAARAKRLLLDMMLLAGRRRLRTIGEEAAPTAGPTATAVPPTATPQPPPPTETPTLTPLPTAVPTALPTDTAIPTPLPTAVPTLPPTPKPTLPPTPAPTAVPTLAPTLAPTPRPTAVPPTALPTAVPTLAPTPKPSLAPTLAPPTPVPPKPTPIPTAVPTRPMPTAVPTWPKPTPLPTLPRPTMVPTRVWSTPVPTLARPTPVPTLPRPTAVPTLPRPTAIPTLARPTAIPTLARPTPAPTLAPTRALALPTPLPPLKFAPGRRKPPTPTPAPAPQLSPRPTVHLTEAVRNALGCLGSAPEPFSDGGVYLNFCLKRAALVQVKVFDLRGKPLWESPKQPLGVGNQQVFYDGWVHGARLPAGTYLYQVDADYGDGQAESRQEQMHRARARRR